VGDFYGTRIDLGWIWAGLETFEAGFLMFSWAKKKIKNILFFFLKS
jgi:hypothetical protein